MRRDKSRATNCFNLFNCLVRRLKRKKHLKIFSYGWVLNEDGTKRTRARLNKVSGDVEFVLWKAGEQGHSRNYWHRFGCGWIARFKPDIA